MKFLIKFFKWLLIILALTIAILYITDTDYLIKAVRTIYLKGHTTAYLEDYKEFDNQIIENATAQPWQNHEDYNSAKETETLKSINKANGTWLTSSSKMTVFGLKIIMMVLMKVHKPIPFQWQKVMCLPY